MPRRRADARAMSAPPTLNFDSQRHDRKTCKARAARSRPALGLRDTILERIDDHTTSRHRQHVVTFLRWRQRQRELELRG